MAEDTTAEAVLLLLQDQPRGLLVARDELSGWINSFDAYKTCRGTDAALWLSMHRGRQVIKDRVGHKDRKTGRRRVIHVPRAAVSITGTIQPKTLAAALVGRYQAGGIDEAMDKPGKEHFDNGLAARLLFTMPPRTPKKWTDDELLPEDVRPMTELVDRLLALDMPVDEKGRPQPRDIPLSARAKREWVRFFTEHNEEIVTLSGDLAAAWSKLEGYTARFALLVHLVRSVTGDTMVDPGAVDEQSIAAGVKLSKWFGDEAARVYAIIGGDTETPEACEERELIRIMRDHDGEITVRGLMQASRHYRSSAEEAEASLGRLVAANKATVWVNNRTKGGGRPVPVYTLIDSGDGNTTGEIPAKNGVVVPLPPDEETKLQLPPDESATDLPPRW
jgi:hypothetical protein